MFTGTIQQGNVTKYLISKAQFDQTVVSPDSLTSSTGIFGSQNSTVAGQSDVGYLSVYAGGGQTNNIYEPTFYYVLPEWFSVNDFSTDYTKLQNFVPNTNNGIVGAPKLSLFNVSTETPGVSRQVVKIDYSGTGYNFLAGQNATNQIHLNTLPDGVNGTYQGMIYIVSPTTKLTNPANMSNFAPSGITFNPDWVQGNIANLYYAGSSSFTINRVGGANTVSVAQGNQNDSLIDSGVSNLYDSNEMEYAVRLINASGANLSNVVALVNLPQKSDTSFTFQLSGRPVYDGDKTKYTFLYSTELGDLKSNSDPDGTKPDETGYVTADQVTDWTKIKSIIIKTASLSNNEYSERLIFTGTDPNLVNDAGKTGYLSTGFYSDTTKPLISSEAAYNASTAPNKVKPANITITGEAKINYKLQYTDENGEKKTVDLPNLSTNYDLAKKNTMMSEDAAIALANKDAASSIPANYEIKSATLQSGGKTWQTDAPEGKPVFGGNIAYFYNGATVILQAVPIQRTITYQVIDENNPSNPIIIHATTDLLNDGQAITGNQGSNVPTVATTTYNVVKSDLEKKGYIISSNSSTVPETFGSDNTDLTIYVTHKITQVNNPNEWPSTSTDEDKVSLSETIIRTINVSGLPTPLSSVEQKVNFTRTAVVDEVTGKVVGYIDPSDSTKTITDGNAAWTSTNANWNSWTSSNVPEGYYIESAKVGNDNYRDVTTNANGIITGLNSVAVTPEKSSITVNVVYNKVSLDLSIKHNPITNTYNGNEQPVSDNIIDEITHTVTSSNTNVPVTAIVQAIKDANLTSADYSYTDVKGNVLTGIPTNAGDYHIILNQNGLDKLNKVAGGLTINYDPSKSYVNYTIEKAQATAELEGNNFKTYDAKEVTNIEVTKDGNIKVTAKVPDTTQIAYELQTNDYDWYNEDGSTKLNGAPINVGKYTIKLNRAGIENIKMHYGNSENINWADDAITGSATYEITKAIPNASFTGQGEKTYDGTQIAGYAPSLIITAPGSHDVALGAGTDYVWTKDGQTFTTAPTDAGAYTVSLTSDGIAKIKAINAANLDWSNVTINENASYTINKAQATVNFDQPASQTVEYGKNMFDVNNFKPSISTNNQLTVDVPKGVDLSIIAGDFEFANANGIKTTSIPTELGTYTVTLSDAAFKKLQSQTNNYDWVNAAKGTYIINKATNVAVNLTNINGGQKVVYTGNPFTNSDINVDDYQVTLGNGQIYQLVAGDLEFVPNQDPTNVSSYKVQLSKQGKKNIAKIDSTHYSYNFDNAGTGSFEIQKAIPSIEFNASAEKIFDGVPIALDNYITKPSVTVAAPGKPTITLEAGDYVWEKDDITYTTAPSNVGNYSVKLSESGKSKILQNSDNAENIDWTDANISGEGSYVITEAKASANLSGDSSKMYDGKPVTTAEINTKNGTVEVTIAIPNSRETVTYKLQTGDYTWNTSNGDAPTEAGSYTLSLSETELTNLQRAIDGKWGKGNVKLTDRDLKGEATFTINRPNITISGNHVQTEVYTGNPQVINPDSFPITLKSDSEGPVPTIPDGTLTSNDFVVKDKDGNPVDPTDVGDYTVYLTPNGVDKLKKLNPNYNWPTTDQEIGTLTVTPDSMNVTLSGNGSKVSDGQSANVALSTLLDNLTGKNLNKDGLTLDDFTWNTSDGNAPNEVGNYTMTLNENGLKKLQDNNPNYTVKAVGKYKYTITAASQRIEYVDSNGNVIKTIDNIGTDSSNYGDKVDFDVKKNLPKDYKLVDSNVPAQITVKNSVTKFLVEPDIITTTETKTITRTIIVENPDGSEKRVAQTVTFTRPKYTDPVNSEVTYGKWDKSSGSWEKYSTPNIPGYTSNEVAGEEITPNTEDKTVTVKYTKNPAIETTETKTITRTIIVENPDGSEKRVAQTVTFTRSKYTDPVNGEVTYGKWDKSSGSWEKYSALNIPGYTSNEVAEEEITPNTEDKVVRITYSKQQKLEPENPVIPSKHEDDEKSEKIPQVESLVSSKNRVESHTEQKNVRKKVRQVNQKNDHTLPQTGAHKEMLAIISGALTIGIGLLGLGSNRKRKK